MHYLSITNDLFQRVAKEQPHGSYAECMQVVDKVMERISNIEKRPYWIAGYGSILNERSRDKTLVRAEKALPAYVKGYERIFDLKCPKGYTVLNVRKVKPNKRLPLVAVKTSYLDMIDFILRERSYDIVELPVYDWYTNECLATNAVMVMNSDKEGMSRDMPLMNYLQANIYGCYELGDDAFVKAYLNTTKYGKQEKSIAEYVSADAIEHFKLVDSDY